MTQTMKQAADYEAKVMLIQCGVTKYNDTVFSAPSFKENKNHIVTVVEGQVQSCSECKGFTFYGTCAHGLAVLAYIAEEARAASSIEEDEEAMSAEEIAELVALDNGPRAGVFASLDDMVAAFQAPVNALETFDSKIEKLLVGYEPTPAQVESEVFAELCRGNLKRGILGRLTAGEERVAQ